MTTAHPFELVPDDVPAHDPRRPEAFPWDMPAADAPCPLCGVGRIDAFISLSRFGAVGMPACAACEDDARALRTAIEEMVGWVRRAERPAR